MDLRRIFQSVAAEISRKSPEILTGLGIGGMLTAVVLAAKATPTVEKRIRRRKRDLNTDKLSVKDILACSWKPYAPAAVIFLLSAGCQIASLREMNKRNAALATLYSIAETGFNEYRDTTRTLLGEKKEQEIYSETQAEHVRRLPPTEENLHTGGLYECVEEGKTLFYFPIRPNRYFYCDLETLRRAANKLNASMSTMAEPYVSLNDFFFEADLPLYSADEGDLGELLGWNLNRGFVELVTTPANVDVIFTNTGTHGSVTVTVVNFKISPDYDYKWL